MARNRLVNSWWTVRSDLQYVLDTLRAHQTDLLRLGVAHISVFGSVARGEAGAESDIDVLVDLDENQPIGIFEYARMKLYINELLQGSCDVVNRRTLKPLLRANILHDAVHAF
jgi:predicted nucleotidyltransferase